MEAPAVRADIGAAREVRVVTGVVPAADSDTGPAAWVEWVTDRLPLPAPTGAAATGPMDGAAAAACFPLSA